MKFQIVKQTENYFVAVCPYHDDKEPSLMVHRTGERAGQYKCYGCGAWGKLTNEEMADLGCVKTQTKRKTPEQWERLLYFCRNAQPHCLIHPIRSAQCQIVGIMKRFPNGRKVCIGGSELGLFYDYPAKSQPQLFITEGLTDYLTLSNWGLWAVGAASATINPQIILDFCLTWEPKEVIIIVDNDKSGLQLTYNIQGKLKIFFNTSLIIPPNPYKDIRQWVEEGKLTKEQFLKLVNL